MVIVAGGCVMLLTGIFGKIGAMFASIPTPVIGGMLIVMFGIITAVGISNLQVMHFLPLINVLKENVACIQIPYQPGSWQGSISQGVKDAHACKCSCLEVGHT